ncbi:AraC family transcriptional regulator [Sphingobacterium sp. ML3W]|uniref:AraC family transcriptional regulator n=1 Tax=Sphingobacterium sp. ML3W TaxID=1538644 RepID=UPI00249A092A|nr:AraC family transcriptional regulator [Sphingobacterium sp. ML3W]WFA82005.1 AraC family transcriptional regulator [Sphingobacterium sp. ML3W]
MNSVHTERIGVRELSLINTSETIRTKTSLSFVYVIQGKGAFTYDGHTLAFDIGKFIVVPQHQTYHFESTQAKLIFIQCPLAFVDKIRLEADRIESCENLYKLQYISNSYHARAGCVFKEKSDENFAEMLVLQIAREFRNKTGDYLIIRNSISILLNLIARNLIGQELSDIQENQKAFSILKIITYIQQYAKDKEKTRIQEIASHFGIAKNYFGEYFKQQTGISYQDYLLDYRLKLVETYLRYSSIRLGEIAHELQFSDESHLSKLFKKHRGLTPNEYRKQKS